MPRILALIIAIALLAALIGCGGGVDQAKPRQEVPGISGSVSPVAAPQEQATAEEANFQGWKAIKLTNGMVTLVVVPDIGGRIVEYRLGSHSFLWLNPDQAGKTYPAPKSETERVWHNFGGFQAIPGPKERWQGPPDPLGSLLTEGRWQAKITVAKGRHAEVELTSAKDNITGLQLTRIIKLFGGSSQARIVDRLTNVGTAPVDVYLQQMAHIPGQTTSGTQTTDKSRLYIPLNAESKQKGGFVALVRGGADQFKALSASILQVAYGKQDGRIGVDTMAGWVAHVDESQAYAFIQRFTPSKLGDYPEQGSTVTVDTAATPAVMTLTLITPTQTLQPDATLELASDWYATHLNGPITGTSDVAAIHEPLKLIRKEDKLQLTGVLGVFAPGKLALILQDAQGKAIGQPITLKVTPSETVIINQSVPDEKTARALVIELQNDNGTPLGQITQLPVGATVAANPQ